MKDTYSKTKISTLFKRLAVKESIRNEKILNALKEITGKEWEMARGYIEHVILGEFEIEPIFDDKFRVNGAEMTDGALSFHIDGSEMRNTLIKWWKDVPVYVGKWIPSLTKEMTVEYTGRAPNGEQLFFVKDDYVLNILANYLEKREALAQGAITGFFEGVIPKDVTKMIGSFVEKEAYKLSRLTKAASVRGRESLTRAEQVIQQRLSASTDNAIA